MGTLIGTLNIANSDDLNYHDGLSHQQNTNSNMSIPNAALKIKRPANNTDTLQSKHGFSLTHETRIIDVVEKDQRESLARNSRAGDHLYVCLFDPCGQIFIL